MRKIFLYRLSAATFFCFFFLLIKSEDKCCKNYCAFRARTAAHTNLLEIQRQPNGLLPYDGFFIKL